MGSLFLVFLVPHFFFQITVFEISVEIEIFEIAVFEAILRTLVFLHIKQMILDELNLCKIKNK